MSTLPLVIPLWVLVWLLHDISKSLRTLAYHSVPLRHKKETPSDV